MFKNRRTPMVETSEIVPNDPTTTVMFEHDGIISVGHFEPDTEEFVSGGTTFQRYSRSEVRAWKPLVSNSKDYFFKLQYGDEEDERSSKPKPKKVVAVDSGLPYLVDLHLTGRRGGTKVGAVRRDGPPARYKIRDGTKRGVGKKLGVPSDNPNARRNKSIQHKGGREDLPKDRRCSDTGLRSGEDAGCLPLDTAQQVIG